MGEAVYKLQTGFDWLERSGESGAAALPRQSIVATILLIIPAALGEELVSWRRLS